MRRWAAVALLLVLPFTLAPRTSLGELGNGWTGYLLADSEDFARGPATALVVVLYPPSVPSQLTLVSIDVSNDTWTLLSAPHGCTTSATSVECSIAPSNRTQHTLRLVVSAPGGARIGRITAAVET